MKGEKMEWRESESGKGGRRSRNEKDRDGHRESREVRKGK